MAALRGVQTINEIGQEFGVHPVQAGQWKKEIQAQACTLFEGCRGPQPVAAHKEPERLHGELGRLKMELDWLKKSQGQAHHGAPKLDRCGVHSHPFCGTRRMVVHLGRCGHIVNRKRLQRLMRTVRTVGTMGLAGMAQGPRTSF